MVSKKCPIAGEHVGIIKPAELFEIGHLLFFLCPFPPLPTFLISLVPNLLSPPIKKNTGQRSEHSRKSIPDGHSCNNNIEIEHRRAREGINQKTFIHYNSKTSI